MIYPEPVSAAVSEDELLARFILYRGYVRKDLTVKPEAFIPHPYPDLSVTQHDDLSEEDLWGIAWSIAEEKQLSTGRPSVVYGRADIVTGDVTKQNLQVQPWPTPRNRNHVNITGWPPDKPSQKIKALELAAGARYVARPN